MVSWAPTPFDTTDPNRIDWNLDSEKCFTPFLYEEPESSKTIRLNSYSSLRTSMNFSEEVSLSVLEEKSGIQSDDVEISESVIKDALPSSASIGSFYHSL